MYAYWKMRPTNTRWVRETYRKRFAIETSYRQMHQGRARTCTRIPLVRLLLVGIALVLRNVWVGLHYAILSTPRRGGRRLELDRLTLETMLLWLETKFRCGDCGHEWKERAPGVLQKRPLPE